MRAEWRITDQKLDKDITYSVARKTSNWGEIIVGWGWSPDSEGWKMWVWYSTRTRERDVGIEHERKFKKIKDDEQQPTILRIAAPTRGAGVRIALAKLLMESHAPHTPPASSHSTGSSGECLQAAEGCSLASSGCCSHHALVPFTTTHCEVAQYRTHLLKSSHVSLLSCACLALHLYSSSGSLPFRFWHSLLPFRPTKYPLSAPHGTYSAMVLNYSCPGPLGPFRTGP